MSRKYGIKIMMSVDDYVWVTKDHGRCDFTLVPQLYNTFAEAKAAAKKWGKLAKVEPYSENNILKSG